jgi:DNA helicase HerA-like ATPase
LASCDTIEEFVVEQTPGGGWKILSTRAPEALGRAGDPVVLLPRELSHEVIGSLPDPKAGIDMGKTYGPNPVEVTLKPDIFQMHIGVFGNPGKGKSYSTGVMLEEAYTWDIPSLVLDVNGEMAKTAEALGGLVITLPDRAQFGLSLNLLTPPELVSIAPNVTPGTQYAELIELAHDKLRTENRGGQISFQMLRDRIKELGTALETRNSSIAAAISRVSVLEKDPLIGTNFDFIKMLKERRIVVLDCRFLSLRQTQLIAAAAARVLQRHGSEMARKASEKGDKEAENWFALFFVDEAHAVVPNDSAVVSTQVLYELARMGRHVRTGLILSSQSPSDLDVSVLKRLQTRFMFALEKDQLRTIGGVTADISEEILRQLPKLPRGICAVSGSSELIRHGFLLEVRSRVTPVGGTTPTVFRDRVKKAIKE